MGYLLYATAIRKWLAGSGSSDSRADLPCIGGAAGEIVANEPLSASSLNRWITAFVFVGVLARAVRYYLCFPLWDDESFLCVNFIERSWAELLQPLDYHQMAPVLFLWIERASVRIFGFSEYALRLFPFVCSIASLFLFHRVASKLLSGAGLLFAVAIFAVSYPGIRYAAEAKPYGTDTLISLVFLTLVVEWYQRRDWRVLIALAALMPLGLGVSLPAVFVAGGFSLVVGSVLWRDGGTVREWRSWIAWNVTLIVSFAIWMTLVSRVQGTAEGEFMEQYWKENFPPIRQPWSVPLWMVKTHASDFLAYPLGGPNWASSATFLVSVAGLWRLFSRRRFVWLGLLLAPASLHLLAAALQKYPYGGHVKFSQYLAPMICCVTAAGMVQIVEWLTGRGFAVRRSVAWSCGLLMLIGCGSMARDLASPYKTRSDERARAFAKAFWYGTHFAEEVACIKSDLKLDFIPEQHRQLSWSAHYLCNRAIEISRSKLRPADFDRVSVTRPLRCVLYRDSRYKLDEPKLASWLDEMQQRFVLIGHESIPFPRLSKNERQLLTMEYIDSYKFIPREASDETGKPKKPDGQGSIQ